jgi:hypothetical protein
MHEIIYKLKIIKIVREINFVVVSDNYMVLETYCTEHFAQK